MKAKAGHVTRRSHAYYVVLVNRSNLPDVRAFLWSDRKANAWLLGTDPAYLSTGVTSLLKGHCLQDLKAEFDTFDMVGANLESRAHFKSVFGGELTPYYEVITFRSAVMKYVIGLRRPLRMLQRFFRMS